MIKVLLAASTHPGEEEILTVSKFFSAKAIHNVLIIIVLGILKEVSLYKNY